MLEYQWPSHCDSLRAWAWHQWYNIHRGHATRVLGVIVWL